MQTSSFVPWIVAAVAAVLGGRRLQPAGAPALRGERRVRRAGGGTRRAGAAGARMHAARRGAAGVAVLRRQRLLGRAAGRGGAACGDACRRRKASRSIPNASRRWAPRRRCWAWRGTVPSATTRTTSPARACRTTCSSERAAVDAHGARGDRDTSTRRSAHYNEAIAQFPGGCCWRGCSASSPRAACARGSLRRPMEACGWLHCSLRCSRRWRRAAQAPRRCTCAASPPAAPTATARTATPCAGLTLPAARRHAARGTARADAGLPATAAGQRR